MSRRLLPLLLVIISLVGLGRLVFNLTASTRPGAPVLVPITPVVDDDSFVDRFGRSPTAGTPDALRIQTHLACTEQQLHQHTPGALQATLRQRRIHLLPVRFAARLPASGYFPTKCRP